MSLWNRRDTELNDEIEAHLRMAAADREAHGDAPEAARNGARREFGNEALVKEVTRDMWGWRWLERLAADLRYAARMLRKNPGFTTVVVLTLALGIGANTAIFSVIHAALTPYAIPHPERVVLVWTDNAHRGWHGIPASGPDFQDWRASGVFSSLTAVTDDGSNLRLPNKTERIERLSVTGDFFQTLASPPEIGRYFTADEMRTGGPRAVVLTDQLWRSLFAADRSAIGKTVVLDGVPHTVIGVTPKNFPNLQREQVYTAMDFEPPMATSRGMRSLMVAGRLRDGLTLEAAERRMSELSARLARSYPDDDGMMARLQPIEQAAVEDAATLLEVLFAAVGFVLLIACANIANLVLARGAGRIREMTVRAALGAGRWRLVRQLVTENLLLALLGSVVALVPAMAAIRLVKSFEIELLPHPELISLNWSVLAFNFALAIGTGLLFGLVPAWQSLRVNMSDTLKVGSRGSTAGTHRRLRGALVVAQVALALVLLAGAGLMLESFMKMRSVDPGYDPRQLLTMKIALSESQYPDAAKQAAFYDQVLERGRALPGVMRIAAVDELPLSDNIHGTGLFRADRPEPRSADVPIVLSDPATPDYFDAMRIPLRQGRWFTEADRQGAPPVALIDDYSAHRYWPNENPIGKALRLGRHEPVRKIVGVVGNVETPPMVTLLAGRLGQVYVPFEQSPKSAMTLVIRYRGDSAPAIAAMRDTVRAIDVDQPVFQVRTMEEVRGVGQLPQKLVTWLLSAFALVALVLAGIGLYGVMAYSVGQRTREFGIRMSLGAQPRDVWGGVLRQGAVLAAIGLAIGLLGAFALTRLMGNLLFKIGATDPLTFAAVTLTLAAVTMFAAWLPARKATRVDPVTALRDE
jgi:putative ABC transport system permease protein